MSKPGAPKTEPEIGSRQGLHAQEFFGDLTIPAATARFIAERAASLKVDIPGRIQWIETAWEMIQCARRSLKA